MIGSVTGTFESNLTPTFHVYIRRAGRGPMKTASYSCLIRTFRSYPDPLSTAVDDIKKYESLIIYDNNGILMHGTKKNY